MPTHKDLPDNYLRGERRRGPAAWSTGTLVVLILCLGLAVGIGAAPSAPVHQRAVVRHHHHPARRTHRRVAHGAPKPRREVDTAPEPRPAPAPSHVLAVGVSVPGKGRPPYLIVTATDTVITARSRSPMPLHISSDSHHGQSLRPWTVLQRGETKIRVAITGWHYGYCFDQYAGGGYAATRACSGIGWHEEVNGARLADGAPLTVDFRFSPDA